MDLATLGWGGLIAGVLLLVVSAVRLAASVRRNRPVPPDDSPGAPAARWALTGGWRVGWPVRIWLGLLTLSVVILILASAALLASLGEDEPNIFILEPTEMDTVEQHTLVRGTFQNLPDDQQIWLLVAPRDKAEYYAQPEPVLLPDEQAWSAQVVIGGPDSTDEAYDLYAVLADDAGSAILREHMTHPERTELGAPLTVLPAGVRIYEHFPVVRQ